MIDGVPGPAVTAPGVPSRPDWADVRRSGRAARRLLSQLEQAATALRRSVTDIPDWHARLFAQTVDARLAALPLDDLRLATAGRLPLSALREAGFTTVGQILPLTESDLDRIRGVGLTTARAVSGAISGLRASLASETRFRIDFDPGNAAATQLLLALGRYDLLRSVAGELGLDELGAWGRALRGDLAMAGPAASRVRWWFSGTASRELATSAAGRVASFLGYAAANQLADRLRRLVDAGVQELPNPWPRFEAQAADYYALLSEFVAVPSARAAEQGFLTADVVASVAAQPLDGSLRTVDLRGYQSFGARFALARRRVILGDEMGLGKTIQALAGIAHLRVAQHAPVLVVCPATVMPNWEREVAARTCLPALSLHGEDRQDEVTQWLATGAVGITTFDTLRRLELPPDLQLLALVVDEAHYVKNPDTLRSRAVRRLTSVADHVWFLTGTPMENRVEEFTELIRYLQSDLIAPDGPRLGSVAFRERVSPVYLRRNAADVLAELPPRQQKDEWVRFTATDRVRYRDAVNSGNLMQIRQAGYGEDGCSKLERLGELLADAANSGLKTVVYSYFLRVLDLARTATATAVFGPITGSVAPAERQAIIDDFARHDGPAVLFAQIQAGGVGLNIQAASVVVICEPQLTPTSEEQAVARSHRMGQIRPVQVYRILAEGSVDETILGLVDAKRADFDSYARRSSLAEASPDAVDLSLLGLTRQVILAEQARELR